MPRAYRPRLTTGIRAHRAAKALGAVSWHLYQPRTPRTPHLYLVYEDDSREHISLKDAEARAKEKQPS